MPTPSGLSDRLDDALDALDAAGLGLEAWSAALARVRDLTGSRVAQLTGISRTAIVPFNWTTETNDWCELVEAGGADIRVNSRRRAGLTTPLLAVRDEASFDTAADRLNHPVYGDFLQRWDYSYVCLTPVARARDVTTTLSVTRGATQGGLSDEGKRLFATAGRRVRHAVRTQETLQQRTLESLVAAFDQTSQIVFACNGAGRVLACTPGGESLLAAGDRLMLASGRLTARLRQAATWLSGAIAQGCSDATTIAVSPGVVHDARGERPLVVEIIPVPAVASDVWGTAVVLVAARELDATRAAGRLARLGAATMGFTPAEESVARDLLAGRSPTETANELGIAVGTVRVHVRNLYAKAGVRNQLAFAALMGSLR